MPSLNLSKDYLIFHDPISVTYSVKTGEGAFASGVAVNYVQRNSLLKSDFKANPALLELVATVFHMWTVPLAGIVPKLDDKIVDSVGTWRIISVEECDRDSSGIQRYRCICREWL